MHRHPRFALRALGTVCFVIAVGCAAHAPTGRVGAARQAVQPPAGANTLAGVDWLRIPVPTGGTLSAAVARPAGAGPHPVLIILHGTHGFAHEYVALARDLAREAGVVAVAACWFAGRRGAGVQFVTPIECPEAPPMPVTGMTPEALAVVGALVDAVRTLPGVQADRVALLGHSRGAVATLYYALERGGTSPQAAHAVGPALRAVVLNSGAYPPELVARAGELSVPTLLLHGTADSPAEGGSDMTAVGRARAFAAALAAAGRVSEVEYFEGAGHNALVADEAQRARSVRRMVDFLRRHGIE